MANKIVQGIEAEVANVKSKIKQALAPIEAKVEAKIKEDVMSFDAWFASRRAKIGAHHYKEIIMADMKAREVAMQNTMAKFDEALAKYGIKLK